MLKLERRLNMEEEGWGATKTKEMWKSNIKLAIL